MTEIQIFAFPILPLSIAVAGAAIGFFYVRAGDSDHSHHLGE